MKIETCLVTMNCNINRLQFEERSFNDFLAVADGGAPRDLAGACSSQQGRCNHESLELAGGLAFVAS